ncbi:MAG: hypothetical protein HOQ10_04430 [Frateuria sp.]|nr:hypothetical protein [Frateuria sp.]
MPQPNPPETRQQRNHFRLHGRDPGGFEAKFLPTGMVQVTAPSGAAFYPVEGWISRFVRHLHQGLFDARRPATLTSGHAGASGEGGTG